MGALVTGIEAPGECSDPSMVPGTGSVSMQDQLLRAEVVGVPPRGEKGRSFSGQDMLFVGGEHQDADPGPLGADVDRIGSNPAVSFPVESDPESFHAGQG